MIASKEGKTDIAKILLEYGAEVDARPEYGGGNCATPEVKIKGEKGYGA